ncbi:hypothetical protein [Nitrosophilus kaiyonis]|uniref:hypothetical protein n=1 Tax=Nitrosophilus kaiyonis TaxID=2930200 RepID=UPI0024927471|nr:hypothetical protein [Nitrosophilus kaiyonis]
MVKKIFLLIFIFSFAFSNIYEKNCVNCHKIYGPSLKKLFFDYLLHYSSEKRVKKAIFDFLRNPSKDKSLMDKEYLKKFGIKQKSKLSDKELKKAIDIYWNKYKVIGRIK